MKAKEILVITAQGIGILAVVVGLCLASAYADFKSEQEAKRAAFLDGCIYQITFDIQVVNGDSLTVKAGNLLTEAEIDSILEAK